MRTLFSVFYDGLIIISLMILLSFPVIILNKGQAVSPGNTLYSLYLVSIAFCYFWLMVRLSGQTIGMKAWHFHYDYDQSFNLAIGLLIRFSLFIPVSILCLFNGQKRERGLQKISGISKILSA